MARPRERDPRSGCATPDPEARRGNRGRPCHRRGDVEDSVPELRVPAPVARGRLLEDRGHLLGRERRVGRPDERGGAGDLRSRVRRAGAVAVDAGERAGKLHARVALGLRGARDGGEDALARRRERHVRAGVREDGALAEPRRGADGQARAARALRSGRLEERRRILDLVAFEIAVPDRRDEERTLGDRVVDRPLLDRRRARAAEAQVDHAGAVVDGPDDRRCLLDVAERAVGAARLDDHQPRIAAAARDPLAVRDGAGGERRHERAVSVAVGDLRRPRPHVVGDRLLRREIGSGQVGAGVDDGDRHGLRAADDRFRDLVEARGRVLPLERPGDGGDRERGLVVRVPPVARLHVGDARETLDGVHEADQVAAGAHLDRPESRKPAHDLRLVLREGCPESGLTRHRRRSPSHAATRSQSRSRRRLAPRRRRCSRRRQ